MDLWTRILGVYILIHGIVSTPYQNVLDIHLIKCIKDSGKTKSLNFQLIWKCLKYRKKGFFDNVSFSGRYIAPLFRPCGFGNFEDNMTLNNQNNEVVMKVELKKSWKINITFSEFSVPQLGIDCPYESLNLGYISLHETKQTFRNFMFCGKRPPWSMVSYNHFFQVKISHFHNWPLTIRFSYEPIDENSLDYITLPATFTSIDRGKIQSFKEISNLYGPFKSDINFNFIFRSPLSTSCTVSIIDSKNVPGKSIIVEAYEGPYVSDTHVLQGKRESMTLKYQSYGPVLLMYITSRREKYLNSIKFSLQFEELPAQHFSAWDSGLEMNISTACPYRYTMSYCIFTFIPSIKNELDSEQPLGIILKITSFNYEGPGIFECSFGSLSIILPQMYKTKSRGREMFKLCDNQGDWLNVDFNLQLSDQLVVLSYKHEIKGTIAVRKSKCEVHHFMMPSSGLGPPKCIRISKFPKQPFESLGNFKDSGEFIIKYRQIIISPFCTQNIKILSFNLTGYPNIITPNESSEMFTTYKFINFGVISIVPLTVCPWNLDLIDFFFVPQCAIRQSERLGRTLEKKQGNMIMLTGRCNTFLHHYSISNKVTIGVHEKSTYNLQFLLKSKNTLTWTMLPSSRTNARRYEIQYVALSIKSGALCSCKSVTELVSVSGPGEANKERFVISQGNYSLALSPSVIFLEIYQHLFVGDTPCSYELCTREYALQFTLTEIYHEEALISEKQQLYTTGGVQYHIYPYTNFSWKTAQEYCKDRNLSLPSMGYFHTRSHILQILRSKKEKQLTYFSVPEHFYQVLQNGSTESYNDISRAIQGGESFPIFMWGGNWTAQLGNYDLHCPALYWNKHNTDQHLGQMISVDCKIMLMNITLVCVDRNDESPSYDASLMYDTNDIAWVTTCLVYGGYIFYSKCILMNESSVSENIQNISYLTDLKKSYYEAYSENELYLVFKELIDIVHTIKKSSVLLHFKRKCLIVVALPNAELKQSLKKWTLNQCSSTNLNNHLPVRVEQLLYKTNNSLNISTLFKCRDKTWIASNYICDSKADCKDGLEEQVCISKLFSEMFLCINGRSISLHATCDYINNCGDYSDESKSLCHWERCKGGEFQCTSGQCVDPIARCDLVLNCLDGSDEKGCNYSLGLQMECPHRYLVTSRDICIFDQSSKLILQGCYYFEILSRCHDYQCPGFYKCKLSYCVPLRYVCNGLHDCPYGEDEIGCPAMITSCPGLLRCISGTCLLPLDICDGVVHCPEGDDERMCDRFCPNHCFCNGIYWICTHKGLQLDKNSKILPPKYLRLQGDQEDIKVLSDSIFNKLRYLDISGTCLKDFPMEISLLTDIQYINVTSCCLKVVKSDTFGNNQQLIQLEIGKNFIKTISNRAFAGAKNLNELLLQNQEIESIGSEGFYGLNALNILDLSKNNLEYILAAWFEPLSSLLQLKVHENPISKIDWRIFNLLPSVYEISTDSERLCCISKPQLWCNTMHKSTLMCNTLQEPKIVGIMHPFMCSLALIFDIAVIIFRLGSGKNKFSISLISLAFADLCQAGSLLMIFIAVMKYGNAYPMVDSEWRASISCKLFGMVYLSFLQISCISLLFATYDTFIIIMTPYLRNTKSGFLIRLNMLFCTWGIFLSFTFSQTFDISSMPTKYCFFSVKVEFLQNHQLTFIAFVTVAVVYPLLLLFIGFVNIIMIVSLLKKGMTEKEMNLKSNLKQKQLLNKFITLTIYVITRALAFMLNTFLFPYYVEDKYEKVTLLALMLETAFVVLNPVVFSWSSTNCRQYLITFFKSLTVHRKK